MPRLLHLADVHLGARHDDLGPTAAAQRERQFAAFERAIELALAEKVDLVLLCGDLFDSNSQPRRSVERAAAELGKLAARHIPVVIIPGTHDCYEPGSIYRVFDLAELAGAPADGGASRRERQRRQSHLDPDPLPPRDSQERSAWRLSLGRDSKKGPACLGSGAKRRHQIFGSVTPCWP